MFEGQSGWDKTEHKKRADSHWRMGGIMNPRQGRTSKINEGKGGQNI
jgi:hypothetical protein